jgi:hypothetical protein
VLKLDDASAFAGTISGFGVSDTIDLKGITVTGTSFNSVTGQLTLDTSGSPITLDLTGDFANEYFHFSDAGGNAAITVNGNVACYCRGTWILTQSGEVAVEDLEIGDSVITHSGAAEPIKWIGRRSYAGAFLAGQHHSLPVRIRAGALSEGLPQRDLWVSPQHAMYIDGVLVPAGELVNGISILQEPVDEVHYLHIELASHALVWAEGAVSETFVDDNSRLLFENAEEYAQLYPDEERTPAQFCAERLSGGYEVEMIRWRLADHAQAVRPARSQRAA